MGGGLLRRRLARQRGISILEGLIALAVAASASLVVTQFARSSALVVKEQIAAQQLRTVRNAFESFLIANINDDTVLAPTGVPKGFGIEADLKAQNFLPYWYALLNNFGETYTLVAKKNANNNIQAMVGVRKDSRTNGACMVLDTEGQVSDSDGYDTTGGRRIATMIGADGGWVTADSATSALEAEGAFGAWRIDSADGNTIQSIFNPPPSGALPGAGCPVSVIFIRG